MTTGGVTRPAFTVEEVRLNHGPVEIVMCGEVDPAAAMALRQSLRELAGGRVVVHVDLRAVTRMHVAAIATLVNAKLRLRDGGGDLIVDTPNDGPVERVLSLTGMTAFLAC